IFQVITSCFQDNAGIKTTTIRVNFEYFPTATELLADAGCDGHYRVACIWADHGNQLRCGAARLPADPVESQFKVINTPEPIGSFSLGRLRGGIGNRAGTTYYDKVQVLSD